MPLLLLIYKLPRFLAIFYFLASLYGKIDVIVTAWDFMDLYDFMQVWTKARHLFVGEMF